MPEVVTQCLRCGITWVESTSRKNNDLCKDCRARKMQKIDGCIVWHGHYAYDFITPVDDEGEPVLQGIRICGKVDCVNPSHIEREGNGKDRN